MANDYPVVLCHGLFGWAPSEAGGFPYWGTARVVPSPLQRCEASVGPISSCHDRACELAYQIRGGRVDYGDAHSKEAGHQRYGREYSESAALYPEWSEKKPVHLVGHSMGGPTIWMLQQLLATDFFGWGSTATWVKSLSSISGVLNGSTAAYLLGNNPNTGLLDEGSAGDFLIAAIELHIRLTGDLFDRFYDFDLDHWGITTVPGELLASQIARVARSPMFCGKDNGAYSLTIQALLEQNAQAETHEDTYYFSYVTEQTFKGPLTGYYYPGPGMNPYAVPTASFIGSKTFEQPFFPGFKSADWWWSDGLAPVYSQMFPRIGKAHPTGGALGEQDELRPGQWYHQILAGVGHIDIVAMPRFEEIGPQSQFYTQLFARLASL